MPTVLANGKKFKFPKGTTREQMSAAIDEHFAKKTATAPPAPADTSMSEALGQTGRAFASSSPVTMLARGAESLAPEMLGGLGQSAQDVQAGLAGGMFNAVEGIRQAGNRLMGDEEELSQLNADTELRRRKLAELTQANPTLANVGEVAGEAAPYLLGGAGAAGALARVGVTAPAATGAGGALARTAGAAGAGGAQGYASALTPEEEAAGERGSRATTGALIGGTLGAVAPPVADFLGNKLPAAMNRVLPEDAMKDFFKKTTGTTNDVSGAYGNIANTARKNIDALQSKFDEAYPKVEGELWESLGRPGILLPGDTRFTSPSLTPSTVEALESSDAVRTVMDTMRNAKNGLGVPVVPYPVATQAIRDLNKLANMPQAEGGASVGMKKMSEAMAKELRGSVNEMADAFPEMKALTDAQQKISDEWASKMAPMKEAGPGSPIGTWADEGFSQKSFEDIFLSQESGQQLGDLFRRMPELEKPVKEFWATTRSAQPEIRRTLGASTTRDAMLKDPAARDYATKLSAYLRGGEFDEEAKSMTALGKRLAGKYHPLVNLMLPEKLSRGLLPYGQTAGKMTKEEKLAAALRASTIGVAALPQDEVPPLSITRGRQ